MLSLAVVANVVPKITKSKVPEALGDGRVGRLGSSWERSWGVSGGEVVAGALKNRALDYA